MTEPSPEPPLEPPKVPTLYPGGSVEAIYLYKGDWVKMDGCPARVVAIERGRFGDSNPDYARFLFDVMYTDRVHRVGKVVFLGFLFQTFSTVRPVSFPDPVRFVGRKSCPAS